MMFKLFTFYENPYNTRRQNNFIVLYSRTNMKTMCLSVCRDAVGGVVYAALKGDEDAMIKMVRGKSL